MRKLLWMCVATIIYGVIGAIFQRFSLIAHPAWWAFYGYLYGIAVMAILTRSDRKKKTIIELLEQHLSLMSHEEKIEHLKAIIPQVCEGVSVYRNPNRKKEVNHALTPSPVILPTIHP